MGVLSAHTCLSVDYEFGDDVCVGEGIITDVYVVKSTSYTPY